jgi:integral membrane protein
MDKAKSNKQLKQFAWISLAEGTSFMVLILIAMPLKYMADLPAMVKYVGWAHGLLFVAYVFQLIYVTIAYKWKFQRLVTYFIAAFLPLAPFFVERQVKKMMKQEA